MGKKPDRGKNVEIIKVCVLGSGIMGAGIAQAAAEAGFDVTLRDIEDRFLDKGLATIRKNLERAVSKGEDGGSRARSRYEAHHSHDRSRDGRR